MAKEAAKNIEQKPDPNDTLPRALGRFLLLRRIARGGMGEVFLASTTGVEGAERPVVVKVIRRDHVTDPSFLARFLDEARVQAQLQHSGVAQVIEAALDPVSGEPYAVVEHVEGKSLGDVRGRAVQIGKQIGWADAVAMATLVAEALAHVHERLDSSGKALAIVHRDLSPQNVMVSYAGDVKIIDFGTARGQNRRCHTVSGVVFAKPGYVAPEVANGDSGDAKVDVYALGVMLWELCAGRRFLQGDANVHMAQVARNAKTLPPLSPVVECPASLDGLLAKLTAFDKDERPTARQASLDLAKFLSQAPALVNGERSIRARTAELMTSLFPGEPGLTRREFGKLVASAHRSMASTNPGRDSATPQKDAAAVAAAARESVEAAPLEPEVGELLAGTRWKLKREIGRGASSVVYEGEHTDLGKIAAIKILGAEASRASEFAERFRREARALSRLHHENLIGVFDVGVATGGRLFCVMEMLEGETLEAFLAREKGVDHREALRIADKVLAALEIAHAANLVHRDVKPANVFLCAGSGVKVLDFGLAKTAEENQGATAERKSESSFFGTPEYMAPEQAASGKVDARADLYGVGSILYEMLAGSLPFTGASAMQVLDKKLNGSPDPLRYRAPKRGIPAACEELVMRSLARHPNMRFQTATEMRRAVADALVVPAKRRAVRSVAILGALGCALAASAFVLAGGRLPSLDRYLSRAHGPSPIAAEVAVAEDHPIFDGAAGVTDPNDSWARAERGEDPVDELAAEPIEPPADVAISTEPSEPAKVKGPVRAHPRKRKGEVAHKADKKHQPNAVKPTPEPTIDDEPKLDDEKDAKSNTHSRRKKKSRLAHVEE